MNTDAIIKELEKTSIQGVAGQIEFDDTHDVKAGGKYVNLLFAQWQPNGQRVVLWPKELRSGNMIMPPWLEKK